MAIVELTLEQLEPGVLASAFSSGSAAALIRANRLVRFLWDRLMGDPGERLPWESPLSAIAENHHGAGNITESLGDVFYFQPCFHGHIARKFEITQEAGRYAIRPEGFRQDGRLHSPGADLVEECWQLSARIIAAMAPPTSGSPECRVAVQRIKYHRNPALLEGTTALLRNSLGRWGKLGFAIDTARARAAGPLAAKGVADLFGVASALPLVSAPIRNVNARLARRSGVNRLAEGQQLIETAHYDSRYFSAICGSRDTIRTQVYVSGEWIDLPIAPDTLAVFPGRLARHRFGIAPTLHRVIHCEPSGQDTGAAELPRNHNTTLLIGAK